MKNHGDSGSRGLRVVLTTTITAGGMTAPSMVTVHGLSKEEIPGDEEIVSIPCPGLVAGSDQNGSEHVGYLTFVRGKSGESNTGNEDMCDTNSPSQREEEQQQSSVDARVALRYRELIYRPFIDFVRKSQYDYERSENEQVPDNLRAVSWMDGANGQIQLMTSEAVLGIEEKIYNITTVKHLAARTAVEQAADTAPIFRVIKQLMRELTVPIVGRTKLPLLVRREIESMENNGKLSLKKHKKEGIIAAMSKLPMAMTRAFSPKNILEGFVNNGMLVSTESVLPGIKGLTETYRGNCHGTILEDYSRCIDPFYTEMYLNGHIEERLYDEMGIEEDKDSKGDIVIKPFGISAENRQRSKILSSKKQRDERRQLAKQNHDKLIRLRRDQYTKQEKIYRLNTECESIVFTTYMARFQETRDNTSSVDDEISRRQTYQDIKSLVTPDHFKKESGAKRGAYPTNDHLKAFIRTRQRQQLRGSQLTFEGVSVTSLGKEALLGVLRKFMDQPVHKRVIENPDICSEDVNGGSNSGSDSGASAWF